jgi:hypothetical protein
MPVEVDDLLPAGAIEKVGAHDAFNEQAVADDRIEDHAQIVLARCRNSAHNRPMPP